MGGYTLEFKKGTNFWDLYQALKKDGVKDSQLDKGYEIPWLLDDFDPATKKDEEIREKINDAISFFDKELKKAGYDSKGDKYKELMAVSLFGFVMASKSDLLIEVEKELEAENLEKNEVSSR